MSAFGREALRKLFHLVALGFLAYYHWVGPAAAARGLCIFAVAVAVAETARLRHAKLNQWTQNLFSTIMRPNEAFERSAVLSTTLGCLGAFIIAGPRGAIADAAVWQLAAGDTAAALVGRAFGRTYIFKDRKSWEGALAGLAVSFAACRACGVPPLAALAASGAGSLAEVGSFRIGLDDNLTVPLICAGVLRCMGVA